MARASRPARPKTARADEDPGDGDAEDDVDAGRDAGVFDGVEDGLIDVRRSEDGFVTGERVAAGNDGAVPAELARRCPNRRRASVAMAVKL